MKINKLDRSEILRYLGHNGQEVDANINDLIDECEKELLATKAKYIYKYFDVEVGDNVKIKNTNISFEGKHIKAHLKDCHQCVIVAVTLGVSADKAISIAEISNISKAVIMDVCSTVAVEDALNSIVEQLREECTSNKKYTTMGFSPGYGDLSIEYQKEIISVINAQKTIGLTVSDNNILIPRKSITSIIGISDTKVTGKLAGCKYCVLFAKCIYRKKGGLCGT